MMVKKQHKPILYGDFETAIIKGKTQVVEWIILYSSENGILSQYKNNKVEIKEHKKYGVITHIGINIDTFIKTYEGMKKDTITFFHNFGGFDGHYLLHPLKQKGYIYSVNPDDNTPLEKMTSQEKYLFQLRKEQLQKRLSTLRTKPKGEKWKNLLKLVHANEFRLLMRNYNIMKLTLGLPQKRSNTWKNRIAEFRDNMDIFPSSIKKIGQVLFSIYKDPIYLKKEVDYNRAPGFIGFKNVEELKKDGNRYEYLFCDAFILYSIHKEYSKILPFKDWKLTAASTTYNTWQVDIGEKIGHKLVEKGIAQKWNFGTQDKPFFKYKVTNGKLKKKWLTARQIQRYYFKNIFPSKWLDNEITKGITFHQYMYGWFKGGITFVNEKYRGVPVKKCVKLDINSSYPYQQIFKTMLPYGKPSLKPQKGFDFKFYTIYILNTITNKYGLPWLTPINSNFRGSASYRKTLNPGEKILLTDIDYKEFFKRYNVKENDVKVEISLYFKQTNLSKFFKGHVDKWSKIKLEAAITKNKPLKTVTKLMLNALWGKFATKSLRDNKVYLQETETWITRKTPINSKFYLPFAICITSLARLHMVKAVDNKYENIIYGDTDSLIIKDFDIKTFPSIKIHNDNLGYWKKEADVEWFYARRTKQYIYKTPDQKLHKVFAGINFDRTQQNIKESDFLNGTFIVNQLTSLRTKYGTILENKPKEIKPIWQFNPLPEQLHTTKEQFINEFKKGII